MLRGLYYDGLPMLMLATFALVFLRSIQQQNVIHGNYLAAALIPYAIACAEVASVLLVVSAGWQAVPWVGTGGALGVLSAMWTHRRLRRSR
jgi:hypothetical protein